MLKSSILAVVLAATLTAPLAAQVTPDDNGRGIALGLEAENSSGQVGSFRVYRGSNHPQIVVDVKGTPTDHSQAVTISRGSDCRTADRSGMLLGNAIHGRLSATSPLTFDRLMSGNYSIVVHNNTPESRPVVCGHIYLS